MSHAVFRAPDWLPTSAVIGTIAGLLIAGFPVGVLAGAAIGAVVGGALKAVSPGSNIVSENAYKLVDTSADTASQKERAIALLAEIDSSKWVDRISKGSDFRHR